MKAKKFEVECLSKEKAFDLFSKNVGEETLSCNTKIREIARKMCKECGGLPLALNVVGSAMAGVDSLDSWMVAQRDLQSSREQDTIFRHLEFSYDRLPKEVHKLCFLYCALYPEDFEIDVNELIDRWIAEGFLGQNDPSSVHDMYVDGRKIIYDLKCACLFQEHDFDDKYFSSKRRKRIIKMHDLIRDMALWLGRDKNKNKDKIVVQGEAFSMSEMDSKRLNIVERISIILGTEDFVKKEWQVPACPNLKTLCVRLNLDATNFLSNLQFLKSLRVLDISSKRSIKTLSSEIGELINLEFINLSGTNVYYLPIEMKKLKNLRVLLMDDMPADYDVDNVIHLEVIEALERLKVLRFSRRRLSRVGKEEEEILFLEKLESLPKLEELCVELKTNSGLSKLLNSTKLRDCSRHFKFSYNWKGSDTSLEISTLLASISEMKHLNRIHLVRLNNLIDGSPISDNKCNLAKLRQVIIYGCNSITHLTWLRYAPRLEFLDVSFCKSIEHVVKDEDDDNEEASNVFDKLEMLRLGHLPKLVSIHKRSLPFSSLKHIKVDACPKLRKLPFNSTFASNNNFIAITGEMKWWRGLEWDDNDTTIQNLLHSKSDFRGEDVYRTWDLLESIELFLEDVQITKSLLELQAT